MTIHAAAGRFRQQPMGRDHGDVNDRFRAVVRRSPRERDTPRHGGPKLWPETKAARNCL